MIPNETPQTLDTVGQTAVIGNFKITDATQARILVSLSDKMYTKKELAFVREYSTNAADAHIVAQKPISEIIVELPTLENLNFRIRDFGSGLTEDQIANVYCIFGESTKRNSNEQNGMLGYGCKAGFAHADSFTVTSWINGEKSIYQCVKGDSTKLHSVVLLNRSASDEPTGIEVCIPVKQNSLWTVHQEAANFYKHWPVIPTIKNLHPDYQTQIESFRANPPTLKGEGWEIRPKSGSNATGVAYMGFVAYQLDWNVMFNRMSLTAQKRVLFDLLQSNDVTLHFKMGEVQFVDSREHLEYTDFTLNAIMTRIEAIFACIKDAIQEKFTTASNLWEAKKLYNAIFGTGLIEVERGEDSPSDVAQRIKILDGNLMKLESTFLGEFSWNGIQLKGSGFDDINRFDNTTAGIQSDKHDPIEPVMVTYRKKKNRTKVNRCTAEKNNDIKASDFVAVVINDTGKKTNQSLIARYLIFKDKSIVRTVHILNFINPSLQADFNKEYSFDTVPVLKMSDLLADAKVWHSSNKTARNYGGGGGGSRPMQFMDLEAGTLEEVEVPIRELEDGGLYIELGEGRRHSRYVLGANNYTHYHQGTVMQHLKTLVETTGLDLDRVYIIPAKVRDSKWFGEAKNSGDWTNVWKVVKENLTDLGIDVQALVDARAYDACEVICKDAADKLAPLIREKNSYILSVMETVTAKTYTENGKLIEALDGLGLLGEVIGDTKPSLNYEEVKGKMRLQYPMLSHYNYELEHGRFDDAEAKEIARYINAMDVYVELYGDETPKAEEKVEETVAA
jgi:hypothetical protein